MSARSRRALAAAIAAVALMGVAGCDKPTPAVTLYSGGITVQDNAFSYCFDGQNPQAQPGSAGACRIDAGRTPKVLRVRPGDTVTVDVDKTLADRAWFVALRIQGQPDTPVAASQDHIARFQPDFSKAATQSVDIRELAGPQQGAKVLGLWTFVIVPR